MLKRVHIEIRGAVQGVGFRPFIYRLASEHHLAGWVMNAASGVSIDVEGEEQAVERFVLRIEPEKPGRAFIQSFEYTYRDPSGYSSFAIRESDGRGELSAFILPDIATCPECLAEITDPANRRFGYPFTNCTNCGPRFTIIGSLPYDRPNTSMRSFTMCNDCRKEYENPGNRRFHAQPNACPHCGPHLEAWDPAGVVLAGRDEALDLTVRTLLAGGVVAMKGLGGFHLMVDATNASAVATLRQRKQREEKPLAILAPDLAAIREMCEVSLLEERLLRSAESPIVLLTKRNGVHIVAEGIAPGNPILGVMLPYTPLHHLLLRALKRPIVATSGNLTDEPICTDEHEALVRLGGIADLFLVHNRPIVRYVDDSVVRILSGRELVLRRSRGYAPLPFSVERRLPDAIAVGGHLKSTVAIARNTSIFISQHLGDLATEQALRSFRATIRDFVTLYDLKPSIVVADKHPDYISHSEARELGLPVQDVQHHVAHVAACMAENALTGEVLGVSWDGTGWGDDGTIWGGEFLAMHEGGYKRVGAVRSFLLPGGEAAMREPRRSAIGMLNELSPGLPEAYDALPCLDGWNTEEKSLIRRTLEQRINTPRTSSAGRLFDGVASLLGLRQAISFEGQAAMELEWLATSATDSIPLPVAIRPGSSGTDLGTKIIVLDWTPCLQGILEALKEGIPPATIARGFHAAMAQGIARVVKLVGQQRVVLSGGCFQNALLTTMVVRELREQGFTPYWHQRVPPNDGGISLGQLYAALVLHH